jgi:hypothetical protein
LTLVSPTEDWPAAAQMAQPVAASAFVTPSLMMMMMTMMVYLFSL